MKKPTAAQQISRIAKNLSFCKNQNAKRWQINKMNKIAEDYARKNGFNHLEKIQTLKKGGGQNGLDYIEFKTQLFTSIRSKDGVMVYDTCVFDNEALYVYFSTRDFVHAILIRFCVI
jgi:hypothetical protein